MSVAYESPSNWRRPDCTGLCWQRFVQVRGEHPAMLTHHDLDGHERAWRLALNHDVIETGPLVIDATRHMVSVDGVVMPIRSIEFEILQYLAQRLGGICPHDDILTTIWSEAWAGEVQHLRAHVWRLRKNLGPAASMIRTHPAQGYELAQLPPCRSESISTSLVVKPYPLVPHNGLGKRQAALLDLLGAAEGRSLPRAKVLSAIWGYRSVESSDMLLSTVRRLQQNGHDIHHVVQGRAYGGSVWLGDGSEQ